VALLGAVLWAALADCAFRRFDRAVAQLVLRGSVLLGCVLRAIVITRFAAS
jgi:hypothetical protein